MTLLPLPKLSQAQRLEAAKIARSAPMLAFAPKPSTLPIQSTVVPTSATQIGVVLSSPGQGRIILEDGSIYDGVTGTVTGPPGSLGASCPGCSTPPPIVVAPPPVTIQSSTPSKVATAGFIDINSTLNVDGFTIAALGFAVWYLFLRK